MAQEVEAMTQRPRRTVAIITAKGNNESIPNKNLLLVRGQPLVTYPITAAKSATAVDAVYVSTDCPRIAELARGAACKVIERPKHLCTQDSDHGDTILHALGCVCRDVSDVGCVVVLLGNTVMVNASLIDTSVTILESCQEYDSVMSVWQAQDDHPFRALRLDENNALRSFSDARAGTSRQGYPPAYYYDQGVWTFRTEVAYRREGPDPWWWMGSRVFLVVRNWVTGRDIHSELDVQAAEWWLNGQHKDEIVNASEVSRLLQKEGRGS